MAAPVTLSALFAEPAGSRHHSMLTAYLSQPSQGWQAGGAPRGPMLPEAEAVIRGSRHYGSGYRGLTVRQRQALQAPVRRRQAMAAARQAEAARRQSVRQAAAALGAFLRGSEAAGREAARRPARTMAEALERRYSILRRERQGWQAVMAAAPYGRSVLDPAVPAAVAVNGAETLAGERWQQTPWQVRDCRSILVPAWSAGWLVKAPIRRAWRQALPQGWLGAEAAAAVERGAKWQRLTVAVEPSESSGGRRQARSVVRVETAAERGARMRQLLVEAGFSGSPAANAGG